MEKWNKNREDSQAAENTSSVCKSIAISPFTSNVSHITHHASSFHVSLVMYFVVLLLVFPLPISVVAENSSSDLDVKAIIKKIDELYRSESSYAEVEMQIRTPHCERTLAMELWTKPSLLLHHQRKKRASLCYASGLKCGTISPRQTRQ